MVQQYGIPPCVHLRCLATIHKLDVVCTQSCSSPRMVLRYLTSVLEGYHIGAVLHASSVAPANGVQGIALRWRSWCVVLKAIMYQCLVHPQCRRAALHWCVMAGVGGSNNDCHTGQVVRTQAWSRVIWARKLNARAPTHADVCLQRATYTTHYRAAPWHHPWARV